MKSSSMGRAEACANIALAKYWGKSSRGDNLTAVPSLSLTLDSLRTRTQVVFDESLKGDSLELDGRDISGQALDRTTSLLDRFRTLAADKRPAHVTSSNNFPTAAGLASSASGFAALAVATAHALGLNSSAAQLSSQARKSSASAARSLFEAFALLEADTDEAEAFLPAEHWDVAMVVGVISSGPKAVGSTGGMVHTKETCPYYPAWQACAPAIYEQVKTGVQQRDFEKVATAMEHSTRLMHATMFTSLPPILYLKGPTVELMHEVAARRAQGSPIAYTMDAGPNVKVFTLASFAEKTSEFLHSFPGVESTIICKPGPAATTLSLSGTLETATRDDSKL